MKLYHGTSAARLPSILKDGIKPRGKGKGNWKHSVDGNPNVVYLTIAYALYFAWTATDIGKNEDLLVLEIDTAKLFPFDLVPDEDFLEQATRKGPGLGLAPIEKSMKYRTAWYRRRLRGFSEYWKESVDGLGNCGYMGTIPPAAITRYAVISHERIAELVMSGMDPSISLLNYKLVGDKYRNWIKWAFGDPLDGLTEEAQADIADPSFDRVRMAFDPAFMRQIPRDGIEVVNR